MLTSVTVFAMVGCPATSVEDRRLTQLEAELADLKEALNLARAG